MKNSIAFVFVFLLVLSLAIPIHTSFASINNGNGLTVASWNLKDLGDSKANAENLLKYANELTHNGQNKYDIIFLQELKGSSGTSFTSLCNHALIFPYYNCERAPAFPNYYQNPSANIGPSEYVRKAGNSEFYGVMYKKSIDGGSITLDSVGDTANMFSYDPNTNYNNFSSRPPLKAVFDVANTNSGSNYRIMFFDSHITFNAGYGPPHPDWSMGEKRAENIQTEILAVQNHLNTLQPDRNNIIFLGDLNVGAMMEDIGKELVEFNDDTFFASPEWNKDVFTYADITTPAGSSHDRIILSKVVNRYYGGDKGIEGHGVNVSDHKLIWAKFYLKDAYAADSYGFRQSEFAPIDNNKGKKIYDKAYLNGNGFPHNGLVNIHITKFPSNGNQERQFLSDGIMPITSIVKSSNNVQVNSNGGFSEANNNNPKLIWSAPKAGLYNVIVDVNQDGNYQRGVDFIDIVDDYGFKIKELFIKQKKIPLNSGVYAKKTIVKNTSPVMFIPDAQSSSIHFISTLHSNNVDLYVVDQGTTNLANNHAVTSVNTNQDGDFGWMRVWTASAPACEEEQEEYCEQEFLLVADNDNDGMLDEDDNSVLFTVYKNGEPDDPQHPPYPTPIPIPKDPVKNPTHSNCVTDVVKGAQVGATTGAIAACLIGIADPLGWLAGPGKAVEITAACGGSALLTGALVGAELGGHLGSQMCQEQTFCTDLENCNDSAPVNTAVYTTGYKFNPGHKVLIVPTTP